MTSTTLANLMAPSRPRNDSALASGTPNRRRQDPPAESQPASANPPQPQPAQQPQRREDATTDRHARPQPHEPQARNTRDLPERAELPPRRLRELLRQAGLPPVSVEVLLNEQAVQDLSPEQLKLYNALARRLGFADAKAMAAAAQKTTAAQTPAETGEQPVFRTPQAGSNGLAADQRERLGMGTPTKAGRQNAAVAPKSARARDAAAAGEPTQAASKTGAPATPDPVAQTVARLAGQPTAKPTDRPATQVAVTRLDGKTQTPEAPQPKAPATDTHVVPASGRNGLASDQSELLGQTATAKRRTSAGGTQTTTQPAADRSVAGKPAQTTADPASRTAARQLGQPQATQVAPEARPHPRQQVEQATTANATHQNVAKTARSTNDQAKAAAPVQTIAAHNPTAARLADRFRDMAGREKRPAHPQPNVPRTTHAADRPAPTRQADQPAMPQTPRTPQSTEHAAAPAPKPQGPPQHVINAQADAVARRYGQQTATRTPDASAAAQTKANAAQQLAAGIARATEQKPAAPSEPGTSTPQASSGTLLETPSTPAARPAMATAPVEQAPAEGKAVDQVVAAVRFQATPAMREMTVQLTPSELGQVRIEIRTDADGLRGMVQVDNARTLSELQREAPQLIERLEEAGIRVKDLEFQMNDQQRGEQGNPQHGQQAQNAYAQFQSNMGHGQRGQTWDADSETESTLGSIFDHDETDDAGLDAGEYVGSDALNVMI